MLPSAQTSEPLVYLPRCTISRLQNLFTGSRRTREPHVCRAYALDKGLEAEARVHMYKKNIPVRARNRVARFARPFVVGRVEIAQHDASDGFLRVVGARFKHQHVARLDVAVQIAAAMNMVERETDLNENSEELQCAIPALRGLPRGNVVRERAPTQLKRQVELHANVDSPHVITKELDHCRMLEIQQRVATCKPVSSVQ